MKKLPIILIATMMSIPILAVSSYELEKNKMLTHLRQGNLDEALNLAQKLISGPGARKKELGRDYITIINSVKKAEQEEQKNLQETSQTNQRTLSYEIVKKQMLDKLRTGNVAKAETIAQVLISGPGARKKELGTEYLTIINSVRKAEQKEREELQEALRQAELITLTETLIRAEFNRRVAEEASDQDSSSSSSRRHNSHPEDELGLLDLLDDLEYKGEPEQTQEEQTTEIREQLIIQSGTDACQACDKLWDEINYRNLKELPCGHVICKTCYDILITYTALKTNPILGCKKCSRS